MKTVAMILLVCSSLAISAPALARPLAQDEFIEKTYCAYAYGYPDAATMKTELLTNAKRQAVNQIFGELIAGSTAVETFVVTSDQIQASSLGYVRIKGDPSISTASTWERSASRCVLTDYSSSLAIV